MDTESGEDSYDESVEGRNGRKQLRTQGVVLTGREAVEDLDADVSKRKAVKQRKKRVMSRRQATGFQVERLDLLVFRANGGVENP